MRVLARQHRMARELNLTPSDPDAPEYSDAELVQRVRLGDEAAFEAMFLAWYEPLCRFVAGYVSAPDVAEEVVQGVFVRIWENRATWLVRNGLKPYLFQAARNGALNHLEHEKVKRSFAERVVRWGSRPGAAQADPGPELMQEGRDFAAAVATSVAQLPHHYRDVLLLRARHQMTHAEIARVLDLPVKTVETRARRGLQLLRGMLPQFF